MPVGQFGQQLNNVDRRGRFIQLEAKDQAFLLRFVGGYAYDGKHFIKDATTGKFSVVDCGKINNDTSCDLCDKYDELIRPIYNLKKEQKNSTDDLEKAKLEVQIKAIQEQARPYKVKISFYYPVLKRAMTPSDTAEATIFQTSLTIRIAIDEDFKNGLNVPDYDYIVRRTEKAGNYYSVTRVDSAQTKALTEDEIRLFNEAKSWNLDTLLQGKKVHEDEDTSESAPAATTAPIESTTPVPSTQGSDDVDPEDIPF